MKILTPSQMSDIEKGAETRFQLSPAELMTNAARAAYKLLRACYKSDADFLIICGSGNNGGDGLALASMLGEKATVFLAGREPAEDSLGFFHLKKCRNSGLTFIDRERFLDFKGSHIMVDALLGTGLNRPVEGSYRDIIEKINSLANPVVSLDIPSGINGSTGAVEGAAVRADRTIAFGLPKVGNILYPGFTAGGELSLSSIGLPAELTEKTPSQLKISVPSALPERPADMHKGTAGHLLIIGGSANYAGAPRFSAAGFLKSGGGYVHLALPQSLALPLSIGLPEAVLHPQEEAWNGSISGENREKLISLMGHQGMVVMGPGLGLGVDTGLLVRDLIAHADVPLLIDGDGLTHIAGQEKLFSDKNVWLTPHPGEMARLLDLSVAQVEQNRPAAVREAARRYNAWVVLKGAHSLIAGPDGEVHINLSGDSSLATAGSGDILSGITAAFHGLGLTGIEALKAAVFVHGLAGEKAGGELGPDGVMASDILTFLPRAVRDYRRDYETLSRDYGGKIKSL